MKTWTFLTTVETDTLEQAEAVMAERFGPDAPYPEIDHNFGYFVTYAERPSLRQPDMDK